MYEKYLDILKNTALFEGIEISDLEVMLDCFHVKAENYKKGSFIVLAGDPVSNIGIILSGSVSVIKENDYGGKSIVSVLKSGDTFGEAAAFSNQPNVPSSIEANEDCSVLFIPKYKIIVKCTKACKFHQKLIENFLKIISDKLFILNRKVEYISIKSMREKLSRYILEQYEKNEKLSFKIPMTRDELSDFLNVSRPSMSRELGRMRDEGLIDFHRKNFTIKNIDKLKNFR